MDGQKKKKLLQQIQLGINHAQKNNLAQALQFIHENAMQLEDDLDVILQFCSLCKLVGELDIGIDLLSTALKNNPDSPALHNLYGILLLDVGRAHEADKHLRLAHEHIPDDWQNLLNLGVANRALNKNDEAQRFLENAKALKPKQCEILENLANCYLIQGLNDQAIEHARTAIKLQPKNNKAYLILGNAYLNMGDIDEAVKYIEKAIKLDDKDPLGYLTLSTIKSYLDNKPAIINNIEKILEESMPAANRSIFYFALGRMYDTKKEWDKAFNYIRQGNQLASTLYIEYKAPGKHMQSLKKTYNSGMFDQLKPLGNTSTRPIFIVGMPRSGTTLLEQVLASHSEIAASGENTIISNLLNQIGSTASPEKYQQNVNSILNKSSINDIAIEYLNGLQEINTDASHITDKTLNHHFYLGLIQIMFPQAPIIYISRSPLDICISCYFQHFQARDMGWTYKPEWITNFYRTFIDTMTFWESIFPENRIFHIQYKDLVSNPEQKIREVLDYCGLSWEPACLEFYKTVKVVNTASVFQVRQPLNKQSLQRWTRYGTNVEPFAHGLAEYLDDADKSTLSEMGIKLKPKRWWHFASN